MYDQQKHRWVSEPIDEDLIHWCKQNPDAPEVKYLFAQEQLEQIEDGNAIAQAVKAMLEAAQEGFHPAMFALGQMYQYGWGLHKDQKLALSWYRKAAQKGNDAARQWLLKRKRRMVATAVGAVAAVVLCTAVVLLLLSSLGGNGLKIKVHPDTQLNQAQDLDGYAQQLRDLLAEYDGELTVSGEEGTHRLLLKYDADVLDLRDFPADVVIQRGDGHVVIQFATEQETQRCLKWLQGLENVVYVQEDQYHNMEDVEESSGLTLPIMTSVLPGNGYASWGVPDMGLDQLSAYVSQLHPNRQVKVGVLDTGVHPDIFEGHRILGCLNLIDGTNTPRPHGHGTHVAGTILDGTRGTNVNVFSYNYICDDTVAVDAILALGLEYAVDHGMDVVNMSLRTDWHSPAFENAALEAVANGVVVVKSAGNKSGLIEDVISCPAENEELLVVAAHDINHQQTSFTNYGPTVDVTAPGMDIFSADYENPDYLVSKNGTSMATPHVTALAALLKVLMPDTNPEQMQRIIRYSCRTDRNPDLYATGLFGAGSPDATYFIDISP